MPGEEEAVFIEIQRGDYFGEDDIERLEIRVPLLNQLVRFEGNPEEGRHVQHVNIRGITFSDAAWAFPTAGISTITDVGDIDFDTLAEKILVEKV